MATIVIRSVKGSALSHTEMDSNFTNLNNDKPDVVGTPATDSLASFDASDDVQDSGYTVATLTTLVNTAAYPVGSIYLNASVSTNPATLLGFGTWVAFGAGRVPIGLDSGDTDFDTVEETGGSKTHTLTEAEMPSHTHNIPNNRVPQGSSGTGAARLYDGTYTKDTDPTGGDGAHTIVQPYIVVYMWKRTV